MSSNTCIRASSRSTVRSASSSAFAPYSPGRSCGARTWPIPSPTNMRKPRSTDPDKKPTGAYFVTYLPIFLDYLAVEKGLAKNSLSAYAIDLRHFGHWLNEQTIEVEGV